MNNTTITDLLRRLIYGKPVKGEPIKNKPKKRTTMPCDNVTLLQWYRGEWINHVNKKL